MSASHRPVGSCQPASPPPRRPGCRRSPGRVAAIVGVLALAVFMSSLDLFIVNLAFPYIGRSTRARASARCPGC